MTRGGALKKRRSDVWLSYLQAREPTMLKQAASSCRFWLSRVVDAMRPRAPVAPSRKPDVPFQPTPREAVERMLALAGVRESDTVYDLGCGDGRFVITAAKRYGARGVGIDIDPLRIAQSRRHARKEGVLGSVTFRCEDLLAADISQATVVVLFLWPEVTRVLQSKLQRDLKPGTRVVSYFWEIGNWTPDQEVAVDGRPIYFWTVPAKSPRAPARSRRRRRALLTE